MLYYPRKVYLWVNSYYILIHSFLFKSLHLCLLCIQHTTIFGTECLKRFFFSFSSKFPSLSSFSKEYFAGLLLEMEEIHSRAQRVKIFCNSAVGHHSTYVLEDSGHSFIAEFFTSLVWGETENPQIPHRQNNLYHTHSCCFLFFFLNCFSFFHSFSPFTSAVSYLLFFLCARTGILT